MAVCAALPQVRGHLARGGRGGVSSQGEPGPLVALALAPAGACGHASEAGVPPQPLRPLSCAHMDGGPRTARTGTMCRLRCEGETRDRERPPPSKTTPPPGAPGDARSHARLGATAKREAPGGPGGGLGALHTRTAAPSAVTSAPEGPRPRRACWWGRSLREERRGRLAEKRGAGPGRGQPMLDWRAPRLPPDAERRRPPVRTWGLGCATPAVLDGSGHPGPLPRIFQGTPDCHRAQWKPRERQEG